MQLKGMNGLAAGGEGVDRAGEDFLAGAALAGDEDVDVGRPDPPREADQLAHVAGDDGVAVLGRQFFDGPQRGALFAFGAGAFEVVDGVEEEGDGVQRRRRLDVPQLVQRTRKKTASMRPTFLPLTLPPNMHTHTIPTAREDSARLGDPRPSQFKILEDERCRRRSSSAEQLGFVSRPY